MKVYRTHHKTNKSGWTYVLAWASGGRRHLQQFAEEFEAMEEGRLKAAQLAEGRTEVAAMSRSEPRRSLEELERRFQALSQQFADLQRQLSEFVSVSAKESKSFQDFTASLARLNEKLSNLPSRAEVDELREDLNTLLSSWQPVRDSLELLLSNANGRRAH